MTVLTRIVNSVLQGVLILAMLSAAIGIVSYLPGVPLPTIGNFIWGPGNRIMYADAPLREAPPVPTLEWATGENGTVDAATGLAPVELEGSQQATVTFWGPSRTEKAAYIGVKVFRLLIVIGAELVLWRLLGTVTKGDPFTRTNERRLWLLAGMVGIGGVAATTADAWLSTFLIQRSAAAGLFELRFSVQLWPLVWGGLLAVLATVWRAGIRMSEDTDGLI